MGSFLLPCVATGVCLLAMWCLSDATPRGQPWTPAVTLPHGCDGLSARRMAVLWTFREPSLCHHVRREFMRNALLDFTPILPTTVCHQRNYVETYSRYSIEDGKCCKKGRCGETCVISGETLLGELLQECPQAGRVGEAHERVGEG